MMGEWKSKTEYSRVHIMDGEKRIARIPSSTAQDRITMAHNADIAAITAERDEALATLAKLREVVPEDIRKTGYYIQDVLRVHSILHPKGNNNE